MSKKLNLTVIVLCCGLFGLSSATTAEEIATVNGQPISAEEVQLQFFLKQIPDATQAAQKEKLINNLIDRKLIDQFLKKKRIQPDKLKLEHQLTLVRKLIEKKEESLEEVFARMNLTEDSLQDFLSLNLAWEAYAAQTITDADIKAYFEAHRSQLDGTRREAAQIVRVLKSDSPPADWDAAHALLSKVRSEIEAGTLTFAEAAKTYSQSPSGKNGGSLGKFEYTGRLPRDITQVAFSLKEQELSQPFRTPFGVHLVLVKQIIPGQLSLEDARTEIFKILSQELWDNQVAAERSRAKIVLPSKSS